MVLLGMLLWRFLQVRGGFGSLARTEYFIAIGKVEINLPYLWRFPQARVGSEYDTTDIVVV